LKVYEISSIPSHIYLFLKKAHLEKLLKAKDTTNEKKTEIERLLPQVDLFKIRQF
jgi:hypothetical protein